MKKHINFKSLSYGTLVAATALLFCAPSADATYPANYYNSLEGKCGVELMTAIKSIVRDHTVISYGTSTWSAFLDTDVKTVDGVDYWWDMYSSNLVSTSGGNHSGLNIEHGVANSWWGKTKNDAYKDLCHLNPSDEKANSSKGNYPLAEVDQSRTISYNNGVTLIGKAVSGQGGGATWVFEPADEYKGDFARAYMYMFTVYNDIEWSSSTNWMYDTSSDLMFKDWAKELLLKWSANDAVSDKERTRNDGIYKNQKNRNPFIDLPDLADHIWGDKASEPFYIDGSGSGSTGSDDTTTSTAEYTWLNQSQSAIDDDWTIEDVTLPSGSSYVWKWGSYNNLGYAVASGYINSANADACSYLYSPAVSLENCTKATLSFDQAAKFQTTLKTLCAPVIREVGSAEWSELEVPTWPTKGSWTFSTSGEIDLTHWAGRTVEIGFKYASSATDGADTWEVRNVSLKMNKTSDIAANVIDTDDSFLVEVWGNNILVPEGARIFDLNGREVSGLNVQRGIYIVTKPTFTKAVKVMVK